METWLVVWLTLLVIGCFMAFMPAWRGTIIAWAGCLILLLNALTPFVIK